MNARLIMLLGCLALPINGQESTTVASEVSSLLSRPDDANKQRDILYLLPKFAGRSNDLKALARQMRLDLLDATDCPLLVRTALEIERAQQSKLADIHPPQQVKFIGPVDQIKSRLKHLVLPDVAAFDKTLTQSPDGVWMTLGPPSSFWSSLVLWIDKHGIKSPEALVIKAEIERFSTQPELPQSQAALKPLPSVQPQAPKKAPEAKPVAADNETTSATPWSVVAVLIVAALGLLWLLLKGRK